MLRKCANPGCSNVFRYLHEGKLFRMETAIGDEDGPTFGTDIDIRKPARHIEFFWLCDNCSAAMTLTYQEGVGVRTKALVRSRRFGSAAASA